MPLVRDAPRQRHGRADWLHPASRPVQSDQGERSGPWQQEACFSAQPKGRLPKGLLQQVWVWKSGALRQDLLRRWTPIAHSAVARMTRATAMERSISVTTRTK